MQLKTLFLLLSCLISANSSGGKKVPKYIREKFTNCCNNENTAVQNLIEIGGYYELKELYRTCSGVGESRICRDTLLHNIVFYEGGTFLYNFSEGGPPYPGIDWGIYSIKGDTVVTQYLADVALLSPWNGWEDKYIVVDKRTLMILPSETRPLYWTKKKERQSIAVEMAERKFLPSKFKPSDKLPPPDSWLKKQSWTQCKGGQK